MKAHSINYLTKEGFRNISSNKAMAFASVSVLFSCLFLIGSAFLLLVNINAIVGSVEKQNIITVFYHSQEGGHDGDQLGRNIRANSNVASAVFVSRQEAYQEALENVEPGLEEYFDEGSDAIFPDLYKVTLKDMSLFSDTLNQLESLEGVESVRGSISLAEKIYNIRSKVSLLGTVVILLLLFVSLFIISNTIRITIYSRRLEINIMQSVGATSDFIRLPFVIEGMVLGSIAAVLATFAVWGFYEAAIRVLTDLLVDLGGRSSEPFSHYAFLIFGGFLLIGLATGALGSSLSLAKYLREKEFVDYEAE
ncbi:MAG: ABC transporter permease [Clostridiales bacterium]|nr:ABC transporter permease [Clostridiales bacterium]